MQQQDGYPLDFIGEKQIVAAAGQTILDASLKAGIPHFYSCGGNAECSTCRILVIGGAEHLTAVNEKEEALRNKISLPPGIRLACQTCATGGPVRLRRIIMDKTDLSVHIRGKIKNEHRPLGEKRDLVLFFLDIRNFTPFVETYLPYDVIHVMRSFYIIFNHIICSHKGQIVDTTGDGFYAVFGTERDLKSACKSTVDAGFAIMKEVLRYNETYLRPYFNTRFEIGMGAHCGEVIMSEMEIGSYTRPSVMGMAVNIASRIQSITKKMNNNFLVSERVMELADYHEKDQKRLVKLKGVSDPVTIFLLGEEYESNLHPAVV